MISGKQQALRVHDDGSVSFEYIEEEPDFRTAATFKVHPALSGEEDKYSFEPLPRPGQYLQVRDGQFIVDAPNPAAASFKWGSIAQWYKNENLNLITMEPPPCGSHVHHIKIGFSQILQPAS